MKKLSKTIGISIFLFILILFAVSSIFIYNFKKPIPVQHIFQTGVTVKNGSILDNNIEIELNGTISKTDFNIKNKAIRKNLKGTMTINEREYSLDLVNFGSATGNLFWGSVTESKSDTKPTYVAYVSDDLSTIYLSQNTDKSYIVAPAKTIDDYNNIKNIIMGYSK